MTTGTAVVRCCPFCNLTIATADSGMVSHAGIQAHEGCIVRNRQVLDALCGQASFFFFLTPPSICRMWVEQLTGRHINGRDNLIAVLRRCLAAIDRWRRQVGDEAALAHPCSDCIDEFREYMSQQLFCEL